MVSKILTVTAPPTTQTITVMVPGQSGPGGPVGPPGPPDIISIGTITTGAAGTQASGTISGASPNRFLNLTIPRGDQGIQGPPSNLAIGTINTLAEGQAATASITGTAPDFTLNLSIPRGYGVRAGGVAGDVLQKLSATDHDTGWHTPTSANTADTIVKRDASGWFSVAGIGISVAAPTLAHHATRKDYVDGLNTAMDGRVDVIEADLTAASALDTGHSQLVRRTAAGVADFKSVGIINAPSQSYHATRKDYVDGKTWPVATISDSTATGRSLVTAVDAAAARTAIGTTATGSAVITAASTAAARTAIGATATGSSLLIAADAAAARTAIGATATGSSLIVAADAAAGRAAIGAGTSSLVIGTTGTTAAAGNHLHTEYVRDRGTGATTPTTDLRRGDVYQHTGLACLILYTGTRWRQSYVSLIADSAARTAISTNYDDASGLHVGFRVRENDTGRYAEWNGTRWVKVGGPRELILDQGASATGGAVGNGVGEVVPIHVQIPAHLAGTVRVRFHGVWAATAQAAANCRIYTNTAGNGTLTGATLVPGSFSRGHNANTTAPVPVDCDGFFVSDGSSRQVILSIAAEGANVTLFAANWHIWLEAS